MKTLTYLFLALVLSACSQPAETGKQKNEAIFLLIENGGSVETKDRGEALNTALHLLQQLTTLSRKRATRNTPIYILFSAEPNDIKWSGTAQQLKEQAGEIKDLITFKSSFSDLLMVFEQIETTVHLTGPDSIHLYWIGPTVHVPFQFTDKPIEVEVPQAIPENLALSRLSHLITTLKIMRVHPDQDQMLQAYLASLGILKRARAGEIDFSLLGKAQTKAHLKTLL